jgi:hypothetical protein
MSTPAIHVLAMDMFIVAGVALEASVQVASQHDSDLLGAKGLADACEFHIEPTNCGVLLRNQGRT